MARTAEFRINERRFRDLMLYVASRLSDDPTFGETKLNKVLFFADFDAFRLLGQPITGAEYQKNKFGPTARLYTVMRDELVRMDQIRVERRMVVDHPQDVVTPLVEPNMEQFSDEEIGIVNTVIAEMRQYTNTQVSDLSHERSVGWKVKEFGDTIPYSSALLSSRPASPAALSALRARFS